MIRITLLLLLVAFLSVYAWKNWFVSLCGAVLLIAVIRHPDFPQNIGGIQGANPWNVLILSIVLAWASRRGEEGYEWDLPPLVGWMLFACLVVVVVGVIRLLLNDYPSGYTNGSIISEFLVNTVKWVIPSLLLFDACRTRQRAIIALGVILGVYFLLALLVLRWMPLGGMGGDAISGQGSKVCQNEIGYNRVTLSMMLAGASWAVLAAIPILKQNSHRFILLGVAGMIALGQALTGGRTGYVTWLAVGLLLAFLRWRRLLLVMPVALLVIGVSLPGVRERMLQGFGGKEGNFTTDTSTYEMTSGRDIAWPFVIGEIGKAPLLGYGRQAMVTTGTADRLMVEYHEEFPHPHQAYLELLLDNGIVGFLLVMPFFFYVARRSTTYLLVRNDPLVCAIGCTAFCLLLALMVGAFGGQTFYPREGAVGMWAAFGLLLRVHVQTLRAGETGEPLFPDKLPAKWFVNTVEEED
ncbi:MAG: O-antigen ligase family protein [Verrucomicrobia bacterium]|nr:O-antigen ligase family protein [Verrucomicrobiota bacterium]